MKGNRFSSLPIAQFCEMGPQMNAVGGAGRAAAFGRAAHATFAKEDGYRDLWARLTDEEQEDLAKCRPPAEVSLEFIRGAKVTLHYDAAYKETACGLTVGGGWCPKDDPDAIAHGTCDLHWEPVDIPGGKLLFVADMKRSEWGSGVDPMSLQVLGYALSLADKHGATHICTGIWSYTEGTWWWSEIIDLDSSPGAAVWARVKAAAMNVPKNGGVGEFSTGAHCKECYGRMKCPAWVLPPSVANSELAPLVGGDMQITNENALRLKLLCERAKDTVERVDELLKDWAQKNHGIVDETSGKVWGPIEQKGRTGFDRKGFETDYPELAERYVRTSGPSTSFRWTKVKGT